MLTLRHGAPSVGKATRHIVEQVVRQHEKRRRTVDAVKVIDDILDQCRAAQRVIATKVPKGDTESLSIALLQKGAKGHSWTDRFRQLERIGSHNDVPKAE